MTKAAKKTKPAAPKMRKGEAEQVKIRRDLGHDFAVQKDDHGRDRLIAGTADARRIYDVSNGGYISTGGIARVRNVDPLKGISSLTYKQREAGARYRADFELAAREGLKTMGMGERVDSGSRGTNVSAKLIDNHALMARARQALVYPEILAVIDAVCGLGLSIKEVAQRENVVRDIPAQLLRMGLQRLVFHYGSQSATRHNS
ncbi:DUF6456 domain-containing protein [Mesorhizobium sp. M1060]|uniref:DUF6456 domain-containing protein n=1 Tax=unclassified Mesorhizobium TaxID=325217 RepID=UPI0003CE8940|nr:MULTISPECIES: DUF6456 domain-containing protein [unclassified Mesorhizobium]ESX31953.1 hypothetical protein X765_03780 [Mesorhizobium sp. LSHC440B00]ESX39332.1 hypothetical protein X763_04640 [Mesorhizobium sp. LSHC432A00]ESX44276.1 hypothetical protein X764_03655 [Mesorhizobium sp. LSHC440A00]WJI59306.1 DUF6456 domain-containing protein [Mesorhizobium sp. C432A]